MFHYMVLTIDSSLNTARRIDYSGILNIQYSIQLTELK